MYFGLKLEKNNATNQFKSLSLQEKLRFSYYLSIKLQFINMKLKIFKSH